MSYWRWLLFAAMARLELREDRYLRLPKATTTMRNVSVLRGGRIETAPGGNRRA